MIGQSLINLAGGGDSASCGASNLFYTGANCGLYFLGILAFILIISYAYMVGVSSEILILVSVLLFIMLNMWGLIPTVVTFVVVCLAGMALFFALSKQLTEAR